MDKYYNTKFERDLPSETLRKYRDSVDSDYGYSVALKLTEFKSTEHGFRIAGTDAEARAGAWIAEEMKRIGLENVTIEDFPVDCWDFRGAYVTILSQKDAVPMFAGSFPSVSGIGDQEIRGEVVYVGEGTSAQYENLDVKDKIVLIDTDCYHSYWFDTLFIQAESRGAKAVIATVTDQGPGTYRDDLITIQNMQTRINIPAVMMSKGDGETLRGILKSKERLEVSIRINLELGDSKAHYVYGMIPGRKRDKYIILGSHYDAYWDGFQDNASSLGSILTIAKAMLDSGYDPENTFIFVSNGAEEFGTKDTRYDFCTGAAAMIRNHPEWVENTVLFNNFELSAISDTERLELNIASCLANVIDPLLKSVGYDGEMSYILSKGVGSDDGVFSKQGVPTYMTVCTHFSDVEDMGESLGKDALENYDHTQFDNKDTYNPEVFDFNNKLNGMINIAVDMMPYLPADYTEEMDLYLESLAPSKLKEIYGGTDDLKKLAEEIREKSRNVYRQAMLLNEKQDKTGDARAYTSAMLKINRIIQKKICKFNPFHMFIYGHVQPYHYIAAIDDLIAGLKAGSAQSQLEALFELDNTYLVAEFDKEVYDRVAIREFSGETPESWGTGEHMPFPDMYDVTKSLMEKISSPDSDFEDEIAALERIREEQREILTAALNDENDCLMEINDLMNDAGNSIQ